MGNNCCTNSPPGTGCCPNNLEPPKTTEKAVRFLTMDESKTSFKSTTDISGSKFITHSQSLNVQERKY